MRRHRLAAALSLVVGMVFSPGCGAERSIDTKPARRVLSEIDRRSWRADTTTTGDASRHVVRGPCPLGVLSTDEWSWYSPGVIVCDDGTHSLLFSAPDLLRRVPDEVDLPVGFRLHYPERAEAGGVLMPTCAMFINEAGLASLGDSRNICGAAWSDDRVFVALLEDHAVRGNPEAAMTLLVDHLVEIISSAASIDPAALQY